MVMFGLVATSMLALSIGLRWKCPPLLEGNDRKIRNLSMYHSKYHNLEQVVDKPTREDKILDLLFQTKNLASRKSKFFPVLENLITKLFLQKLILSLAVFQNQNVTSFYIERQTGMALDQT